jgi:hypothetical protein
VIRRFVGDPVERAKYYDFDTDFLLELSPTVRYHLVYAGGTTRPKQASRV